MWKYNKDNELYHWKTKGSVNGVRRYQNKDGSLTPEGRIHYGVGPARDSKSTDTSDSDKRIAGGAKILNESSKTLNSAANFIRNSKVKSKEIDTGSISTEEMKQRMDRRRTEISYDEMFNADRQKKQHNKEVTAGVINGVATGLGIAASALTIAVLVKNITES